MEEERDDEVALGEGVGSQGAYTDRSRDGTTEDAIADGDGIVVEQVGSEGVVVNYRLNSLWPCDPV